MTTDDDHIAYLADDHDGEQLDDADRRELDDLRALLRDESTWAEPSPGLEDAVVAAVVAHAAGAPAVQRPAAAPRRPRTRLPLWLAGAAAAAIIGVIALTVVADHRDDEPQPSFAAALSANEPATGARGDATFTRTDGGWRIELDATGLPRLDHGTFYEAWLKNEAGVLVPIGTFNEPDSIVLWAGVSPVDFPTITVTQETADGDQSSSGRRVLSGPITKR